MIIADLHIHSKYSRATSKDLTLENLEKYARIKGLDILGTGDFTHPKWLAELKQNLIEDESGILKTKTGFKFVLSTEISSIYTQEGKTRKIHQLILAPNFDIVAQINEMLLKWGRLDYDGRPIFGKSALEVVEMCKKVSKNVEIIPCHIWTPHFSLFGANSGFNSLKECYKDQAKHIFALETGLSSDPAMNWRLSELDNYSLVSFSDAHSYWPWRIGRECTIFDLKDITYGNLINAIKNKNPKEFLYTLEFYPEEGKYHFTGHRNCNISLSPKESLKLNDICPVCNSKLTIGVLERVEKLADRPEGFLPKNAIPFKSLVPLSELLSKFFNFNIASRKVWLEYNKLINNFKSELNVLLNVSYEELKKISDEKLADLIIKNREGKLKVTPGYDGVYGELILNSKKQKDLTEF